VQTFSRARQQLADLRAGQRQEEQRLDLLRFQTDEIEAARLTVGEEEALESERHILANAERLTGMAISARDRLQGDEGNVVEALSEVSRTVRALSGVDPSCGELAARLESALIEVEDIAQELRRYGDGIEADPLRLAAVEERLDTLRRLKRKYGASVEDVIEFGQTARTQLDAIEQFDDRLVALQQEVEAAEAHAANSAAELSAQRHEQAGELNRQMSEALKGLGLGGTAFEVRLDTVSDAGGLPLPGTGERVAFGPSGVDSIMFLVSFNPGEQPRPLEKVASGGETSRFLLALKSVLADADTVPTLVFDEVDVGVGGRHGVVVGERLRQLARSHQVLSITHLPQVAALGDHHLTVNKVVVDGRTSTIVREIDAQDRVVEIAEMMSGTGSETSRRNALELLQAARASR
jgi:DNA repair protein RecN (Recombination protein N)